MMKDSGIDMLQITLVFIKVQKEKCGLVADQGDQLSSACMDQQQVAQARSHCIPCFLVLFWRNETSLVKPEILLRKETTPNRL